MQKILEENNRKIQEAQKKLVRKFEWYLCTIIVCVKVAHCDLKT